VAFDWTTFVLEVLNFLVLVWILKRLLYRPVLEALDARKARVRDDVAKAEALQQEAARLKQQCEERLAHLDAEREQARHDLEQEMAGLRVTGLQGVRKALADEEAKGRARYAVAAAARQAELLHGAEDRAYGNVAAMLTRLASPELTASLATMLIEDLALLRPEESDALQQAAARLGEGKAEIAAAHALDDDCIGRIAATLAKAAGRPLPVTTRADPKLIAGLRVAVGECLLHANLADELAFFRRREANG
jgi:F-type H+-transporting ATPase subunit b